VQGPDILMLDTNVFNHVLDGRLDPEQLRGRHLVATHVQRDEIQATRNEDRRAALMELFEDFVPQRTPTTSAVAGISAAGEACASASGVVPTESFVFDVSRWDEAKWSREDDVFSAMLSDLNDLNGVKRNNIKDVLIAETALRNGWTLVTDDADLAQVASKYGCRCANMKDRLSR
jgi:predicted nucleic acid-binding protein